MYKKYGVLLAAVTCAFFASCAAPFPFLAAQEQSEAADLKSLCDQQQIGSIEKKAGDSLLAQGEQQLGKKKNESACVLFDKAAVCYRIALTAVSIIRKEAMLHEEEQALSKTRDDLSTYKQVLTQIKTMEAQ